jgi:cytochrome c556
MPIVTRSRAWAIAVAAGVVVAQGCASQQAKHEPPQMAELTQAISPPKRIEPPEYLSPTARALLETRMASHARDMGQLVSAIMVLDYPLIGEGAAQIASDASLSRPLTGDATELNSALPARFFDQQDELRVRARELGEASHAQNPFRVADAYGRLSQACVRCHAVYRQGGG